MQLWPAVLAPSLWHELSIQHSGSLMSLTGAKGNWRLATTILTLVTVTTCALGQKPVPGPAQDQDAPVIWNDPGDIKSRDLLNGAGGEKRRPQLPVKFL